MIAYSYVRFSTPEQINGNSLSRQTEATETFCKVRGWLLDSSLKISDLGRSAFGKGQQTGLQGFIRAIEDGRVKPGSVLVVEQLDRLSREQIKTALSLFLKIISSGVSIATLNPERVYDDESTNTMMGLLEPIYQFVLAHEESAKKSFRAKDNWNRKRAEGGTKPMTTRRPAWIDLGPDGSTFVLNPVKAAVIQQIFEQFADGAGARVITNTLNRTKVPNIAIGTTKLAKKHWNQVYVEKHILKNTSTFGLYQPQKFVDGKRVNAGDPIPNYYPPAITEELFYRALAAKQKRGRKRGRNPRDIISLFSGIVYDASNKTTMRLANSSQIEKKKGCFRRIASYHTASMNSWQYEPFERAFLQFITELDGRELLGTSTPDRLPALIAKLEETEDGIRSISETMVTNPRKIATLTDVLEKLEAQRTDIQHEITEVKASNTTDNADNFAQLVSMASVLNSVTEENRERIRLKARGLLRAVVSDVWLAIEKYKVVKPEGRLPKEVRVLTAQVFFQGETGYKSFVIYRYGYKMFSLGTTRKQLKFPRIDLRKWDGKPVYGENCFTGELLRFLETVPQLGQSLIIHGDEMSNPEVAEQAKLAMAH